MSSADDLNPEDFAEAAGAAIADAQGKADVAAVLAEAGLFSVSVPEDAGGMGLALDYSIPVARVAGEKQLRFPLVEQILLARAFAGYDIGAALMAGETTGTIAWQGALELGFASHATFAGQTSVMLVADGDGAALVDLSSVTLALDDQLDPEFPQGEALLDGAKVTARLDAAAWAALRAEARILLAAYVIGAAQGALSRTATYMGTRVQFGRPLSAKQAVRHHLAQMKLLTDVSAAALRRATLTDEFGQSRGADGAFVGALSNATFVVEKAIQLHGGIGFTWELPLHRSLRDVKRIALAMQAGSATEALGAACIDAA